MEKYISKSNVVIEIESKKKYAQTMGDNAINGSMQQFYDGMKQSCIDILSFLDTLEVIDLYEQRIQYDSIKAGIQAHAEIYSFNIESELFNQLTKEQQKLWREEIEQACISGGEAGVELARDPRYKENQMDIEKEFDKCCENHIFDDDGEVYTARKFFELGFKAQKGK